MGETDYKDADWTDEELARIDRNREEFERKHPDHPTVIRGRKYQAEHPELFPPKNQPVKK